MNALWTRVFRTVYRSEPLTGFLLLVGAMNVTIGGIDQSSSLVFLGLFVVSASLGLRWWTLQRRPPTAKVTPDDDRREGRRRPVYALPPQASRPSLPDLNLINKK